MAMTTNEIATATELALKEAKDRLNNTRADEEKKRRALVVAENETQKEEKAILPLAKVLGLFLGKTLSEVLADYNITLRGPNKKSE